MAGMAALGSLAVALGRRAVVQLRSDRREPTNLYCMVLVPPGSGKSPVLRYYIGPMEEAEREAMEAARHEVTRTKEERAIREARLTKLRQQAAEATGDKARALEARVRDEAAELSDLPATVLPRLLAEDTTAESLVNLLAEQDGRIAVVSSEPTFLNVLAGRYSKDRQLNFDAIVKAWDGETIRVDRRTREPEHVRLPALTVLIGVQNDVLAKAMKGQGFTAQGRAARFLYAVPASLVGHRNARANGVPVHVQAEFHRELKYLCSGQFPVGEHDGVPAPGSGRGHGGRRAPQLPAIVVGREALAAWERFADTVEASLRDGGDLGTDRLRGWGAKLAGQVARVAALLHLGDHGWCEEAFASPLDRDVMRVGEYLVPHARRAFSNAGVVDPEVEDAQVILDWVRARRFSSFTRRDAFAANRSRFPVVKDVERRLACLVEHGCLRPATPPVAPGRRGRPPSPSFEVNPLWLRGDR